MKLLVAIPNYARSVLDWQMLERTVRKALEVEPQAVVRIFDDASPHMAANHLMGIATRHNVTVVSAVDNLGYSGNVNRALHYAWASGFDVVCTLNSDCEPVTPFLESSRIVFEEKMADVWGGVLLFPTGRIQSAGFEVRADCGPPIEFHKYDHFTGNTSPDLLSARYVFGVTGAMQFMTKAAGFYSKRYQMGFEDVEFCARQWLEGRRVMFIPAIEAVHSESATRGYFPGVRELQSYDEHQRDKLLWDYGEIYERIDVGNASL